MRIQLADHREVVDDPDDPIEKLCADIARFNDPQVTVARLIGALSHFPAAAKVVVEYDATVRHIDAVELSPDGLVVID